MEDEEWDLLGGCHTMQLIPFIIFLRDLWLFKLLCDFFKKIIRLLLFFMFLIFKFYIGVQLMNNVVLVSGVQQSDPAIHVHVSIPF